LRISRGLPAGQSVEAIQDCISLKVLSLSKKMKQESFDLIRVPEIALDKSKGNLLALRKIH